MCVDWAIKLLALLNWISFCSKSSMQLGKIEFTWPNWLIVFENLLFSLFKWYFGLLNVCLYSQSHVDSL